MDAGTLHKEIAKVCPVTNVTMGKPDDRATWAFNPKEGATQEQIDAGNNVIATIPMEFEPAPVPVPGEEVLYDHESRILALEGSPPVTMDAFLKSKKLGQVRRPQVKKVK
jgi:hypothetical protein